MTAGTRWRDRRNSCHAGPGLYAAGAKGVRRRLLRAAASTACRTRGHF